MKTLYMMIGLPASGKSTWIEKNGYPNSTSMIISSDAYIEKVANLRGYTYNDVFKECVGFAEESMFEDLKFAIQNNLNIIWDQTNLNVKTRTRKLSMIPDDYEKIAVVFKKPSQYEWERRLNSRESKTIPKNILNSMVKSFQMPTLGEGFDKIKIIC